MLLIETTIFYVLLGAGTAFALWLRGDEPDTARRTFQAATAFVFWPLYVPLLLETKRNEPADGPGETTEPQDALADAISQVETELDAALQSLDGWAENVLSAESTRLVELRSAWRGQAERIRELDRLLAQPHAEAPALSQEAGHNERVRRSEEVRRENLRRLQTLRGQLHSDFMGTLAWVRELVTMIHLAKFTGAPASRGEELVAQIAAAVEGLTEVSAWRDEDRSPAVPARRGPGCSMAERLPIGVAEFAEIPNGI